jgi:hypothetical protein
MSSQYENHLIYILYDACADSDSLLYNTESLCLYHGKILEVVPIIGLLHE